MKQIAIVAIYSSVCFAMETELDYLSKRFEAVCIQNKTTFNVLLAKRKFIISFKIPLIGLDNQIAQTVQEMYIEQGNLEWYLNEPCIFEKKKVMIDWNKKIKISIGYQSKLKDYGNLFKPIYKFEFDKPGNYTIKKVNHEIVYINNNDGAE